MSKILIGLSAVIAAASLAASGDAAVNYNASKSNTATLSCHVSHGHRTCVRHHARQAFDINHGSYAGKRMHKPLAKHDQASGHPAGKRTH
jgi:hypothetical protein